MMFRGYVEKVYQIIKSPGLFFLANGGEKQTIAKNVFWLSFAEGINRVLKIIIFFLIARVFGATEYGKFSFALGFVGLFASFSDLTVSKIVTREFAKYPEKEKHFPSILSLELFLSAFALVLIVGGSYFVTHDPSLRVLIWVVGLYMLINIFPQIFYAFFRARQRMEYQSLSDIVSAVLVFLCVLPVIFFAPSIFNLGLGYLVAAVVYVLFVLILFHYRVKRLSFSFDKKIWREYLFSSWPLVFTGVVGAVYSTFDIIFLGYLGHFQATGLYSAAQKITGAGLLPVAFLSMSFYPALSKSWVESKEKLQITWDNYLTSVFCLAIPIMVGGIVLADKLVSFIFGDSFDGSVSALRILFISAALAFICVPYKHIFVVSDNLKQHLLFHSLGTMLNIILNLILITKYSLLGAAYANLITSIFFLIIFVVAGKKVTSLKFLNPRSVINLLAVVCASAIMYGVLSIPSIQAISVYYGIGLGFAMYLTGYLVFKYISTYLYERV